MTAVVVGGNFPYCLADWRVVLGGDPCVGVMLCQPDRVGFGYVHREVELLALLAAARLVVELAQVAAVAGDVEAGLFFDLADQCSIDRLVRIDFPAGKFPDSAHEVIYGSLQDKYFPLAVGDRANYQLLHPSRCASRETPPAVRDRS